MQAKVLLFWLFIGLSAILPLRPQAAGPAVTGEPSAWPAALGGHKIYQVPALPMDQRFAAEFPGSMKRFTDGEHEILLRFLQHETRSLHPASDCYRGAGYSVTPQPVWLDPSGAHWGCFRAQRDHERLLVCERIFDQAGQSWSDTSSWYWHALLGKSQGPWWAVTMVGKDSAARLY